MADDVSSLHRSAEPTSAGRSALAANYWRVWVSEGMSNLADGVIKVALPLVAVSLTRSPPLIAGVTVAFNLPWLLCVLPAGALVDRLDRRRAMLGANTVRGLLSAALVLAVLWHVDSIWILYAFALGAGTAETIYETAGQSIMPQLVRRDLLAKANGNMYAAAMTAREFVGPPLAGMLVGAGALAAFFAPTTLWLVAAATLLLVHGSFRVTRDRRTTMRGDIVEGLRFLWQQRILRTFALMVGMFNFATNATSAVFVLFAVGRLSAMRLSEQAFGLLLATVAAGSVTGSLVARRVERVLGRSRSLIVALLTGTLLIAAPAITADPYLIGTAFFFGGAGIIVANIIMVSLRQVITPEQLLGRVTSAYRLVAYGSQPLGAAIGGGLAALLGLRSVFAIMGVLALTATAAGMIIVTDDAMDTAERHAAAP